MGDATVGEALSSVPDGIAAGDFEDAKDCADDINNGIGVLGAEQGE